MYMYSGHVRYFFPTCSADLRMLVCLYGDTLSVINFREHAGEGSEKGSFKGTIGD